MSRRRVKVGIDVTSALTQGAGIGRYTRELIHSLAHETDFADQFDLTLFSARPPVEPPVANPLPTHPAIKHAPAFLDEKWLYRIWYRLRIPFPVQTFTGRLNLFHSPDFVLPPLAGSIPSLLTVHDLSFLHYPKTFTPALVSYLNSVVPWSVGRATHILADSVATKNDLVELWQTPAEKITVLYSGVNPRFAPVEDPAEINKIRQKYKLGDAPWILSVGTVQPRKNYKLLIQAFGKIAHLFPHNLVITGGKGWLFEDILAEVQNQGLDGRVIFTGFVDDEDLPAIYSGATLLAFPSLYEGFGLPILEAMGCGTPVINSDASCLPEVAGNCTIQLAPEGVDAWANGLADLLKDEELRSKLVAAGYEQTKQFTWKRSAEQLLSIYTRLLLV
ncbi:MAG: glycosyltransferase family 4 protein [Anaerolineae bacterium]